MIVAAGAKARTARNGRKPIKTASTKDRGTASVTADIRHQTTAGTGKTRRIVMLTFVAIAPVTATVATATTIGMTALLIAATRVGKIMAAGNARVILRRASILPAGQWPAISP